MVSANTTTASDSFIHHHKEALSQALRLQKGIAN